MEDPAEDEGSVNWKFRAAVAGTIGKSVEHCVLKIKVGEKLDLNVENLCSEYKNLIKRSGNLMPTSVNIGKARAICVALDKRYFPLTLSLRDSPRVSWEP